MLREDNDQVLIQVFVEVLAKKSRATLPTRAQIGLTLVQSRKMLMIVSGASLQRGQISSCMICR